MKLSFNDPYANRLCEVIFERSLSVINSDIDRQVLYRRMNRNNAKDVGVPFLELFFPPVGTIIKINSNDSINVTSLRIGNYSPLFRSRGDQVE